MATRDRGPFFTAEHGLLLRVRREYQWLTLKCVSIEVGLNHCPARELQGTKHSETVQNRTLPLPESASLSLEPLDETLSKLEEIEVKPFKTVKQMSLECLTEDIGGNALFDNGGSSSILILVDLRIALALDLHEAP